MNAEDGVNEVYEQRGGQGLLFWPEVKLTPN